jgi:serine/threonine-protein kinase
VGAEQSPDLVATAWSACASLERDLCSAALGARGLPEGAGPWVFTRLLGRGHSGPVFLAEDPERGRSAAVRVLDGPGAESLASAPDPALAHPAIAGVLETGDGWIAAEATDGVPLSRIVAALRREPPLRREDAVRPLLATLAPIAAALARAHAAGRVHGGVSPRKIDVRPDGSMVIRDFGFDPTRAARPPTPWDPPLGDPHHLAPEQAIGEGPPDVTTDAWSFASTVYTVATGRHLFESRSLKGLLEMIRSAPLPPLPKSLSEALAPRLVRDRSARECNLSGIGAALG